MLDGLKNCVFPNLSASAEKILTHIRFDDSGVEKWLDRLILSPHLISLGVSVSLSSRCICLCFVFFSFSWLLAHKQHRHKQGGWSRPPPLRSSNMQPGSRMIKAVAGGLHFETINRPPGAESNSKPSISVSPSSRWYRGRGHTAGERADSTFASSSYKVASCWDTLERLWRNSWLSDVISSRLCGFIQLTLQPLTRGVEGRVAARATFCSIFFILTAVVCKHRYSMNLGLVAAAVLLLVDQRGESKDRRPQGHFSQIIAWISHLDCF